MSEFLPKVGKGNERGGVDGAFAKSHENKF